MKDRSLAISKHIKQILSQNENITSIVPVNNISTMVVPEGTTYPFIVIQRQSISVQYTKTDHVNEVFFDVICVSDKADDVIELAVEVRDALESWYWVADNFEIKPIKLQGAYESYDGNSFTETLSFSCYMR